MDAQQPHDPVADAVLATQLFARSPFALGGMVLRGFGPARDAIVETISAAFPTRKLPSHVDDERLLGGVDVAASLATGRTIMQKGLLAEARGGILIVPMAERMSDAIAGRLAQALDNDRDIALILLDDSVEVDDAPPAALLDRCAFHCDLSQARHLPESFDLARDQEAASAVAALGKEAMTGLASTASALGVASLRPLVFASQAARAHAALAGRREVAHEDLLAAARLVLGPRATQIPDLPEEEAAEPPPEPEQPEEPDQESDSDNQSSLEDAPLEEMLVEATAASIPADLLAQLTQGKAPRNASGAGSGKRRKSPLRGKPLGARPGMPRGGARLALIDTLRAAVPWQPLRRRESASDSSSNILMQKDDLRIRRFEEKSAQVTIFVVDASGSAAAARLAEAKGAVELMLAQAYVTRSEVALVAFRGEGAELLLPPTRSLTRARRALSELPGGGGTPLASGLNAACELADAISSRGKTPSLVILTDGRGNIDAEGNPGRRQAGEDATSAAKAIATRGIDTLLVDISVRPSPEAPALAQAMNARFLALPRADARMLHKAITASQSTAEPA
jgi:magnesium chelatase subunit D